LSKYQVVVIGGGPGGYETAIRLNQYGINCALIEQERLGGVCLNRGCIPTKALVKSAELFEQMSDASDYGLQSVNLDLDYTKVFERKNAVVEQLVSGVEFLFRKRNIPVIKARAERISAGENGYTVHISTGEAVEAEYLVIATGSAPKSLPGISIDEKDILSSTGLLNLSTLPKSLAVVGGGVIGCEFASIMNSFGVEVHIIEFLPRIIANEEEEISKRLALALKKTGIKISTGVGVQAISPVENGQELLLSDGSRLVFEKVLMSVGRDPRPNLVWDATAPALERGAIVIDEMMRTSLPAVYAIGDVTGKLPLAHTASKQGLIVAGHLRSLIQGTEFEYPALDYANIPRCTFTHPEVASVGYTEAEARERFGEVKTGKFPFSANGKALAMSGTYGFVKTIARADTDALVGMHIIGLNAAELIAQGAILISLEAKSDAAEHFTFAHPTLSEAVKEALEDLNDLSIHKI
jgi:dihydrolipoamide dehydrogenase